MSYDPEDYAVVPETLVGEEHQPTGEEIDLREWHFLSREVAKAIIEALRSEDGLACAHVEIAHNIRKAKIAYEKLHPETKQGKWKRGQKGPRPRSFRVALAHVINKDPSYVAKYEKLADLDANTVEWLKGKSEIASNLSLLREMASEDNAARLPDAKQAYDNGGKDRLGDMKRALRGARLAVSPTLPEDGLPPDDATTSGVVDTHDWKGDVVVRGPEPIPLSDVFRALVTHDGKVIKDWHSIRPDGTVRGANGKVIAKDVCVMFKD